MEAKSIEASLAELEKLVAALEKGDMDIDQAIETYAQGMKLSKALRQRLNEAADKVNAISKSSSEPEQDLGNMQ